MVIRYRCAEADKRGRRRGTGRGRPVTSGNILLLTGWIGDCSGMGSPIACGRRRDGLIRSQNKLTRRQDGQEHSVTKQTRTVIDTLGRTRLKSRLVTLEFEDATRELFVCFDGEPVARRASLKTGQAGTWISLQPGVVVRDVASDEGEGLEIEEAIAGTSLH
jgi:hypothetical protein